MEVEKREKELELKKREERWRKNWKKEEAGKRKPGEEERWREFWKRKKEKKWKQL